MPGTTTSTERSEQAQMLAHELHDSCLGSRVGRLHRLIARRFDQALRPLGLSLSQMEILSGLVIMGAPVRPAYLADTLVVERSTMSRNLALMHARDLITSAEVSPAGRSMTVTITDHGVATLATAKLAWAGVQADLVDHLGPDAPSILDAWNTELDGVGTPALKAG